MSWDSDKLSRNSDTSWTIYNSSVGLEILEKKVKKLEQQIDQLVQKFDKLQRKIEDEK